MIWGPIPIYTRNWLMSWSNNKELSSRVDALGWNSLKKGLQNKFYLKKEYKQNLKQK